MAYIQKIAQSLLHCMENRTKKLLQNESLISCLYLDPRFNHTLTQTQRLQASTFLKKLYEKIKNISSNNSQINSIESQSSSPTCTQYSQRADEYLNEYLTQNYNPAGNEDIDVYTKIENLRLPYSRVDLNVLYFWRERQHSDPDLYALSNICFAIPPTQVIFINEYI